MGLVDWLRGRKPEEAPAPAEPTIRVTMVVSVDSEHVAGETYDLPVALAERYIIREYAIGELSREYTREEQNAINSSHQVVSL